MYKDILKQGWGRAEHFSCRWEWITERCKQIHWVKLPRDLVSTLNRVPESRVQVLLAGGEKNTMCFLRGHWEPHAQRCDWKGTWVAKTSEPSIIIDVSGSQWHRHWGVKTRLWLEVVPCTSNPKTPRLKQDDHEIKASLGYPEKPHLKRKR